MVTLCPHWAAVQCEHRANVQCWSTCDGEMCVVSRQSQLLCLCHGGGVECGELDCIKSRDNCTVNGVEQNLETFVCIIEYFPSAPVVSMSAPVSRLLECGGWHPDNLSSVTRVRCWRRLRVTTGHCMYGPCQHHAAPGTLPFPALTFSVYDF